MTLKDNMALQRCLSGSSGRQEPRIVWLLLKNCAIIFQGNKLGLTPVHSAVVYNAVSGGSDQCAGTVLIICPPLIGRHGTSIDGQVHFEDEGTRFLSLGVTSCIPLLSRWENLG